MRKNTFLWEEARGLCLVIIGTAALAFGTAVFILPFGIVTGGLSGLAIVLSRAVPAASAEGWIAILSLFFFALGAITLGMNFAARTLVSALCYPIFVSLFSPLASPDVLGGSLYLKGSEQSELSLLLAALIGGAVVGVGCAISFFGGGSTGGTDIPALMICKFIPRLNPSLVIFSIDAAIIVAGAFVSADPITTLLGIASALICAAVIDRLFPGTPGALVAEIVSDRAEELTLLVVSELGRTVTVHTAVGGYSGQQKSVVRLSLTKREYPRVISAIRVIDPTAFITVYKAYRILGEGWTDKEDKKPR